MPQRTAGNTGLVGLQQSGWMQQVSLNKCQVGLKKLGGVRVDRQDECGRWLARSSGQAADYFLSRDWMSWMCHSKAPLFAYQKQQQEQQEQQQAWRISPFLKAVKGS
eukprot:1155474-Pelagomonas_calceolata.AAC.1